MSTILCAQCTALRDWGLFKKVWEEPHDWRSPEEEYDMTNLGHLDDLRQRAESCTFYHLVRDTFTAYLSDRHGSGWGQRAWHFQLRLTHPSLYFSDHIHDEDDDCFTSRGYKVIASNEEIAYANQLGQSAVYFLPLAAESEQRFSADRCIGTTEPDWSLLKSWSHACHTSHGEPCETGPFFRDTARGSRGLLVIDVNRRKVIAAPSDCSCVCLSYVWSFTISVYSLYECYEARELAESLPKTLEDAVLITSSLGDKYFWTDSLCIDQLDLVQKQEQINNMHVIFSRAKTTIVAATSPTLDGGIPGARCNSRAIRQHRAEVEGVSLVSIPLNADFSFERSTWITHGWTLQESALAGCCRIFAESEVFFLCNSKRYRESVAEPDFDSRQVKLRYDDLDRRSGRLAAMPAALWLPEAGVGYLPADDAKAMGSRRRGRSDDSGGETLQATRVEDRLSTGKRRTRR